MQYQIKSIEGKILIEQVAKNLQQCVEQNKFNLRRANLRGADLRGADLQEANLRGADLRGANLQGADLREADLQGAWLQGANLQGADLQEANLRGAWLQGANLQGAWLQGAIGINKYLTTPLYILFDQPGLIRAYKIVNEKNEGIYKGGLVYGIGKTICVEKWDNDEQQQCAAGINLATLDWCIREWCEGRKILVCEFTAEDIVCVPIGSDGKFRVKRCTVIAELDLDKYGIKTLTAAKGDSDG